MESKKTEGIIAKAPCYKVCMDNLYCARDRAQDNAVAHIAGPACKECLFQLELLVTILRTYLMFGNKDCERHWREQNILDPVEPEKPETKWEPCQECRRPRPSCIRSTCRECERTICDYCHAIGETRCKTCADKEVGENSTARTIEQDDIWIPKAFRYTITDEIDQAIRGMIVNLMRERAILLQTYQIFQDRNRTKTKHHRTD